MDERDRYDAGMKVRRAVLGDAHVDRTLKTKNAFNDEYQDMITRYAWGEIWTRPGLPRHTRSLLTLALMVALNRSDEFKMHVRAAANNGVTRDEIKEVLLQCAIYAGVPAANSAFHMAQEVFNEMDAVRLSAPTMSRPIALAALTVLELSPPDMVSCAAEAGYSHIGLRLIPATPTEVSYATIGDTPIIRATLARLADTGIRCFDVEILRLKPETRVADFLPVLETAARLGARAALDRRQRSRRRTIGGAPGRTVRPRRAAGDSALPGAHAVDRRAHLRAGRAHRRPRRARERGVADRSDSFRPRRQPRERDLRRSRGLVPLRADCAMRRPSVPPRPKACSTRRVRNACFPATADSTCAAFCARSRPTCL